MAEEHHGAAVEARLVVDRERGQTVAADHEVTRVVLAVQDHLLVDEHVDNTLVGERGLYSDVANAAVASLDEDGLAAVAVVTCVAADLSVVVGDQRSDTRRPARVLDDDAVGRFDGVIHVHERVVSVHESLAGRTDEGRDDEVRSADLACRLVQLDLRADLNGQFRVRVAGVPHLEAELPRRVHLATRDVEVLDASTATRVSPKHVRVAAGGDTGVDIIQLVNFTSSETVAPPQLVLAGDLARLGHEGHRKIATDAATTVRADVETGEKPEGRLKAGDSDSAALHLLFSLSTLRGFEGYLFKELCGFYGACFETHAKRFQSRLKNHR